MDSLSSSRSGSSTSSPDSLRSSSPSSSQLSSSSLYYHRSNSERLHLKGRQRSQSGRLSMSPSSLKSLSKESLALSKAQSRSARRLNDSLVYLDGPQIYTCGQVVHISQVMMRLSQRAFMDVMVVHTCLTTASMSV